MQILGRGMVARSLQPFSECHVDTMVFAGGVAQSGQLESTEYRRELDLLDAALEECTRRSLRIVYFSSGGAVYGPTATTRDELTPLLPTSAYGCHKRDCENLIRSSGVRHLIVRLANLIGPNQNRAQLIPALVQQILSGSVNVQRLAERDILDSADFASILNDLLHVVSQSETIVLASGISIAVPSLVDLIQSALGISAKVEITDSGEPQRFSIERLLTYLPGLSFTNDYTVRIIHQYVGIDAVHVRTEQ